MARTISSNRLQCLSGCGFERDEFFVEEDDDDSRKTLSRTRGSVCDKMAIFTSSALCGLNCECCALDMLESSSSSGDGSVGDRRPYFHGTLLISPRAHVSFHSFHTVTRPTIATGYGFSEMYHCTRRNYCCALLNMPANPVAM
jgi:hypothetical protein